MKNKLTISSIPVRYSSVYLLQIFWTLLKLNYLVLVCLDARHNRHVRPKIEWEHNRQVKLCWKLLEIVFLLLLLNRPWRPTLNGNLHICGLDTFFFYIVKCRVIFMRFYSRCHANHFWYPSRKTNTLKHESNTHATCKLATWPGHVFEESDNRKGLDANEDGRILQASEVGLLETNASSHCGRMARTNARFNLNPTNRPPKPPFTTLARAVMFGLMMTLLPVKYISNGSKWLVWQSWRTTVGPYLFFYFVHLPKPPGAFSALEGQFLIFFDAV